MVSDNAAEMRAPWAADRHCRETPRDVALCDLDTQYLAERIAESLRDVRRHSVVTPREFVQARAAEPRVAAPEISPPDERPVGVAGPEGLFEVGADSCRLLAPGAFHSRLNGPGRFQALAVTGHGAEHVIQLGDAWLATSGTGYGLHGEAIQPDQLQIPLILLNGCSTLRLSGSVVPLHYSLAARLVTRGATVLGPFRNVRGSEKLARAFVRAVLSGAPVSRISRRLNLLLRDEEGEVPCIAAIGDPDQALPMARPGRARETAPLPTPPPSALSDIALEIGRAQRALDLFTDLAGWNWPFTHARAAARAIEAAIQAARGALVSSSIDPLSNDDYTLLRTRLRDDAASLLDAIREDAAAWIGGGRWLQGAYAPVRHRKIDRQFSCDGACGRTGGGAGSTVVDYRFGDPANGAQTAYARECDRCGSRSEWTGPARFLEPLRCRVTAPQRATVTLPTPPDDAVGCILIHRDSGRRPLPWPAAGGPVELDLSRSPVTGRVTLVALSVAPTGVSTQYADLFRDPETRIIKQPDEEMADG